MKKILSLLLVVCMLLSFMCGCGAGEGSTESTVNDEQLIQQTITDYVKSVYAFDFPKAKEVIVKDTELYSTMEQMESTYSVDSIIDIMFEQLEIPSEYKEKITTVMKDWIAKTMSDSKIEVTDINIQGDNATAYTKISTPDLSKFGEILENYEKYITEEQLMQMMQKYSLSLGENTQWDLIVDVLPIVLNTATPEIEHVESETTITLQKIEDKWLILSDEQ